MRKKIKKAFTLVELLVVIAILAILATVSIVGYNSFTKKAKESNDIVLVKQMNDVLTASQQTDGNNSTMTEALEDVLGAGYDIEKLTPTTNEYDIAWDSKNDQMVLMDNDRRIYPEKMKVESKEVDVFKIIDSNQALSTKYSNYLKDNYRDTEITTSTGIDVGNNTNITSVKYSRSADAKEQTVILRTNSYSTEIEVDAINDTVKHYDLGGNVNIINVKGESYHEFGKVKYVTINNGRFVAEENSEIANITLSGSATGETSKCAMWDKTEYKWSTDYSTCTASRKDKNGIKKDETETVNTTNKVTKEPSTSETGVRVYTATFTNPAFVEQTYDEEIARLLTDEEKQINSINDDLKAFEVNNSRKPETMHEVLKVLGAKANVILTNIDSYLWDSVENKICTIKECDTIVKSNANRKKIEFWKISNKYTSSAYSIYLSDNYSGGTTISNLRTGLDVGNNTQTFDITYSTYTNHINDNVIIRTNSGELLVRNGIVSHYGHIDSVKVGTYDATNTPTYNENGIVNQQIEIYRGNLKVNNNTEKNVSARAIIVKKQKSNTKNQQRNVMVSNDTLVCVATSFNESEFKSIKANDIHAKNILDERVYAEGLSYFASGFGTNSMPFEVSSFNDWKIIDNCDTKSELHFKLVNNFTIDMNVTTIARNANIIFDLNGHTITLKNDSTIQIGAKGLIIKDSVGTGGINKNETGGVRGIFSSFANGANLIIDGGNFNSNYLIGKSANAETALNVTINGGNYKLDSFIQGETELANLSIKGGTFNLEPSGFVESDYDVTSNNDAWIVSKK